ncbi:MAG: branched-chain amino acid ABC transporter permease [Spirochaetales bacterium]|nr:branched-chain amino acid ABC transporter permease [Spirochaetales bacterium]
MLIQQLLNGISLGAVYAIIAVGFALVFNILKFSNFSHGGVLTVTAYAGFLISSKLNLGFVPTILLTAVAGGLIAMGIERVAFRRLRKKGSPIILYFVSSITMGMLLENLITVFFSSNFYSYPKFFEKSSFTIFGLNMAVTDALMLIISIVSLTILMVVIYKTRLGIAIRALSMDTNTTSLMGINVNAVIAATFFVVGCLGGIAGVFLGLNYTLYPQLGQLIVKGFIASVLGGLGNLFGAVLGAILLGVLEVTLTNIPFIGAGLSPVVIFVIMLIFLILRPQGIAGKIVHEKA